MNAENSLTFNPDYEVSIMEKIVVFQDYANVNRSFQQHGVTPDYRDLLDYLSEGRFLVEAHTYVPIDPRNPHVRDREIEQLWSDGYLVHTKMGAPAGDTYKCDFDVEITLDLMRTAEIVRPAIVVLVSGDKDFIPVILELRQRGIRVEVAAFLGINAAREVIMKASGFIDLAQYLAEQQSIAEAETTPQSDEEPENFPQASHDAEVWKP
jgi:uncharacterized LabA/DUF88 family protein